LLQNDELRHRTSFSLARDLLCLILRSQQEMAYSKSGALVLREIPPNRILTESDAPFAQGHDNAPSMPGNIQGSIDWIAKEKNLPTEKVCQLVVDNLGAIEAKIIAPDSVR